MTNKPNRPRFFPTYYAFIKVAIALSLNPRQDYRYLYKLTTLYWRGRLDTAQWFALVKEEINA